MTTLDPLEASSPTLLQSVRAHQGEVCCAHARGARLVTGGGDRTLRLWRWGAGAGWGETAVAKNAHRYGVTTAKWSPGGALIASGGVDGACRVWCGASLTSRRVLAAPGAAAVRAACWGGAGRLLAGHDDGAVCVWHVFKATLLARLQAHEGSVHALAAPARGALLLAACTEGVLKVFDLIEVCRLSEGGSSPPAPLAWVDGAHDLGALCADASPDGTLVATGGHDARVKIWQVITSEASRSIDPGLTLEGHGAAVTALSWSYGPHGLLASASLDRTARLWNARVDGACLCVLHAHTRYLTCVSLSPDLRYLVTGSNDKSVRMWSLGSLTIDNELEPPCIAHAHFGIGDLEGIGPIDSDDLIDLESKAPTDEEFTAGVRQLWKSADIHEGAINCISAYGDLIATASSDGLVRTFRWSADDSSLSLESTLGERGYPVLSADFGASAALLLTGGLDAMAQLWDVESGCLLRLLSPPAVADESTGGGGVRGTRVSPNKPPLLLLASDDGVAPLWNLADPDPKPIHVYTGHPEAAVCCAWSPDGRLLVTGGAEGELRVHAAPPHQDTLYHQSDAHDLGVQSCDFAPPGLVQQPDDEEDARYLLATGGSDGLVKLWVVTLSENVSGPSVTLTLSRSVAAHGGGVACVRWGGTRLASGGADRWARVWQVDAEDNGTLHVRSVCAVPAGCAGGATATVLLDANTLVVGTLSGELSLWQLPAVKESDVLVGDEAEEDSETDVEDSEAGSDVRWWGASGVARWLKEYVTRAPGSSVSPEEEATLQQRVRDENVTGSMLMDEPLNQLAERLGYAEDPEGEEVDESNKKTRERLLEALKWLRRDPPPPELCWSAPHALLCPLSHRVVTEPARAADGCTYDRAALHEWFLAADGAVSGVSGRRLRNAQIHPNYRARGVLQAFLLQHQMDTLAEN